MSEFENYLSNKEDSGVSTTALRHMGKQAAVRYIQNETPLNESIAEFAKESSLTLEQIKRVSEYANNDTFATMFKLGFAKNITFPMADASAVAQTVNSPKEKTATPKKLSIPDRLRYIPGQEKVDLEAAFTGKVDSEQDLEKAASADIEPLTDPEIRDAARKFLDVHVENKNAESEKEVLGAAFNVQLAALGDLCKEASRSGNSAGIIGYAIESADPSKGLAEVIQERIGDLVEYGHGEELEKLGMGMMMPNPISGLTQDLEGMSQKLVMAQQAVVKTQLAMQELLAILRGPDLSGGAAQVFGGGVPPPEPPMGPPPMGAPRAELPPVGGAQPPPPQPGAPEAPMMPPGQQGPGPGSV
jgi:hypothetical protein